MLFSAIQVKICVLINRMHSVLDTYTVCSVGKLSPRTNHHLPFAYFNYLEPISYQVTANLSSLISAVYWACDGYLLSFYLLLLCSEVGKSGIPVFLFYVYIPNLAVLNMSLLYAIEKSCHCNIISLFPL